MKKQTWKGVKKIILKVLDIIVLLILLYKDEEVVLDMFQWSLPLSREEFEMM